VLSDDTIVDKLRESGIDIARRTVAKYREAMRIASSVQRRRDKQSAARATLNSSQVTKFTNRKAQQTPIDAIAGRPYGPPPSTPF
jgi:RNA polymerase sigma-54 factor